MKNQCPKCYRSQDVDTDNLIMDLYAKCKDCGELFIFSTISEKKYSNEIENLLKYKSNKNNSELLLPSIHVKHNSPKSTSEQSYVVYIKKNEFGLKATLIPNLFSKIFILVSIFFLGIGGFALAWAGCQVVNNVYLQILIITFFFLFFSLPSWWFALMIKDKIELIITKHHILLLHKGISFNLKKYVREIFLIERNSINRLKIERSSYWKSHGRTRCHISKLILNYCNSKSIILFNCEGIEEPKILKNYLEQYLFDKGEV